MNLLALYADHFVPGILLGLENLLGDALLQGLRQAGFLEAPGSPPTRPATHRI